MKTKNFCSKTYSYDEMHNLTQKYFLSLTPEERLDIVQYLREQFYKIKGIKPQWLNKKVCVKGNFFSEKRKRF
ncbi:MAG: hypothetical protein SNJ64_00275 [Endomicrobiia bacterium]